MNSSLLKRKSIEIDMTKGPLVPKIFLFAIPLAISFILQFLYHSADLAIVGQFAKNPQLSLASVGMSAPVNSLVINLFLGLSLGTNIVISRHIGEKDNLKVEKAVHTSILLALFVGIFGALLGFIVAKPLLMLMGCSGELLNLSSAYLKITFLGIPFLLIYNFCSSISQAKGNSITPLIYLGFSGILNVLLNLLFVIVFKLDVIGVALATIISQGISAILMLFTLVFSKDYTRVNFKKLKINKQELLDILSVGIPSGIQGITFSITNILARVYILKLGEVYVSGQTIYVSLSEFPMAITTSLLRTSVAFTSQNYGAKNYKFIRKVELTILLICMLLVSVCSILFMVFRFYLFSIYTTAPEVIKVADLCFKVCVPYLFLWGLSEVSIGCSKGLNSKKFQCLFHL